MSLVMFAAPLSARPFYDGHDHVQTLSMLLLRSCLQDYSMRWMSPEVMGGQLATSASDV